MPVEVFLSHSSLDREFATSIAEAMRRHAVPVWYSQTNIVGAQQWHDEIGAALQRCDWFTIILSPNCVDSLWVKREFSTPWESLVLKVKSFRSFINLATTSDSPGRYPFSRWWTLRRTSMKAVLLLCVYGAWAIVHNTSSQSTSARPFALRGSATPAASTRA